MVSFSKPSGPGAHVSTDKALEPLDSDQALVNEILPLGDSPTRIEKLQQLAQGGCFVLPKLQLLLELDLTPDVRAKAFDIIAENIGRYHPRGSGDNSQGDEYEYMKNRINPGLEALNKALLREEDSVALSAMSRSVATVARMNSHLGEQFATSLLEILKRDGLEDASSYQVCEALVPIVEGLLPNSKTLLLEISEQADKLKVELRKKDKHPGLQDDFINPLLLELQKKKGSMGLL